MPIHRASIAAVFLLLAGACADERSAQATSARFAAMPVPAGERIAQRECGECHSIDGREPSPLADAPPFPRLRTRYSRQEMAWILDQRALETHRRMPLLRLDIDELTYLLDYWEGLEPAER